jgi:hypothetical protein
MKGKTMGRTYVSRDGRSAVEVAPRCRRIFGWSDQPRGSLEMTEPNWKILYLYSTALME